MKLQAGDTVRVHADVLERGWAGYVRHGSPGSWEFHCTLDTVDEPLQSATFENLTARDSSLERIAGLPSQSQAWRWEAGEPFQVSRLPTGPTYFYEIEARPKPGHASHGQIDSATIYCWIRIETETEAMNVIHENLDDWMLDSIYGPEIHTLEQYEDDDTGIDYFEQAQSDGEVFLIEEYTSDER